MKVICHKTTGLPPDTPKIDLPSKDLAADEDRAPPDDEGEGHRNVEARRDAAHRQRHLRAHMGWSGLALGDA